MKRLRQQLTARGPQLVLGIPDLLGGLSGPLGLEPSTRLAVQLRLAKLLGCPVCLGLFPRLGPVLGLDRQAVTDAKLGCTDHLPPQADGALAWAEALVRADGAAPEVVPARAAELTTAQRRHLQYLVRLELLVHSAGLLFLPHTLIRKAAGL